MYVVIDHFDSFTHNLVQMLRETTPTEVRSIRAGTYTQDELEKLPIDGLVMSPGPGGPEEYPESLETIRRFTGRVPILGVCLGHEQLVAAYGGRIRRGKRIMHGKTDEMLSDGRGVFRNIASPSSFMRYHSLVADPDLPDCLEASAWSRLDGDVMAVRHKDHPVEGVQFHPESIGSESGRRVLENFVNYRREPFPTRAILTRLLKGENLDVETARAFMLEVAEGNITDSQLAGYLCALEAKGITAEEIAGCASVLVDKRVPFKASVPVLDIVGIGGDNKGSFNLSSMAAVATAAVGQPMAKHGGRAVSSFCGSADFYAELGYPLMLAPKKSEELLEKTGFAFLFAPLYHSAMKHATVARRELAVRTMMNLLGPLSSPARAEYQVLGVPEPSLLRPIARAAALLGVKKVMTICSEDGLDEFSCAAPTRYMIGGVGQEEQEFVFDPTEAGIPLSGQEALAGGTAEENAAIARKLMDGEIEGGLLDAVSLNAGAGLFLAGKAESIADGRLQVIAAFKDGRVKQKLDEIITTAKALAAG